MFSTFISHTVNFIFNFRYRFICADLIVTNVHNCTNVSHVNITLYLHNSTVRANIVDFIYGIECVNIVIAITENVIKCFPKNL